jgi:nucleoside-diphosphate-sugar epimerase
MKIAITGANGFVGSTLLSSLQSKGFEPIALVRKSFTKLGIEVRQIDYSDSSALHSALSDVDIVIHNAGKTKTLTKQEMFAANVGLTRKIVSVINQVKHPLRLIYISSQAAAGPSNKTRPRTESDPLRPISVYGKSKALAERVIQNQCTQPYNIVRPCSVYGPKDRDFLELFKFCQKGWNLQIGRAERPLNMIHVRQLADFILHLITNPNVPNETFFATDNQIYTQAQVVSHIAAAMSSKPRRILVPRFLASTAFACSDWYGRCTRQPVVMNLEKFKEITAEAWLADSSKSIRLLGWNPPAAMPELIKETYQWYLSNGWL